MPLLVKTAENTAAATPLPTTAFDLVSTALPPLALSSHKARCYNARDRYDIFRIFDYSLPKTNNQRKLSGLLGGGGQGKKLRQRIIESVGALDVGYHAHTNINRAKCNEQLLESHADGKRGAYRERKSGSISPFLLAVRTATRMKLITRSRFVISPLLGQDGQYNTTTECSTTKTVVLPVSLPTTLDASANVLTSAYARNPFKSVENA